MKRKANKRKYLRDSLGRFTTRKKLRHEQLQRRANRKLAKELSKKKPSYRIIQIGPIEEQYVGYYFLINAVIPGRWATPSVGVFEEDEPDAQMHWVVWKTPIKDTIGKARKRLADLLDLERSHADVAGIDESEYVVLSVELWGIYDKPYQTFLQATFELNRMPRWVREAP